MNKGLNKDADPTSLKATPIWLGRLIDVKSNIVDGVEYTILAASGNTGIYSDRKYKIIKSRDSIIEMIEPKLKFTKVTSSTDRFGRKRETTDFFVNGIKVATTRKYRETYCTIKIGSLSNIRDKVKPAYATNWDRAGLEKILGTKSFTIGGRGSVDFRDGYPDTTWGDTGFAISMAGVKEAILNFIETHKKDEIHEGTVSATERHIKSGWYFANLSAGTRVKYNKTGKEITLTSVGYDHAYGKDKNGKEYKITSIKDISNLNEDISLLNYLKKNKIFIGLRVKYLNESFYVVDIDSNDSVWIAKNRVSRSGMLVEVNKLFIHDGKQRLTEETFEELVAPGKTEIWFTKPEFTRKFRDGSEGEDLPRASHLELTHILLGSIAETDLDNIYEHMQAEHWSPNGEAKNLIREKGLNHTSMSVGDTIVKNGVVYSGIGNAK